MGKALANQIGKVNENIRTSYINNSALQSPYEGFFTCKEVMAIFGISRLTLIKYTRNGTLRGYPFGKRLMYRKDELLLILPLFKKLLIKKK